MKSNQSPKADQSNLLMLEQACPMHLGIPAKLVQAFRFGEYAPLSSADVLGLSERYKGRGMFNEYLDKQGYTFSFGIVSEEEGPGDPDDHDSLTTLRFEFVPIDLLVAFPQSAQLEDLFIMMYENHPLYDPNFCCDEGFGDMSVISFESEEGEGSSLRSWIARTFLPKIWPDLLAEAYAIVETRKFAAVAMFGESAIRDMLVERSRNQLCNDPKELSFYAG